MHAAAEEIPRRGARPNISRLSVATGLTRKEVAELLRAEEQVRPNRRGSRQEQRALRVARGWMTDPRYQDARGKPGELEIKGASRSFESLVKTYAGDVTAVSVLRELERMSIVRRTSSGKLKLRAAHAMRRSAGGQAMRDFGKFLRDFVYSAAAFDPDKERSRFFAFREAMLTSPDTAALFQRTFSRRAALLLNGIDQWVKSQQIHHARTKVMRSKDVRVGLGVYVFHESSADTEKRPRTRSPRSR